MEYRDDVTSARVQVLTPGEQKDDLIYQTHPRWTKGMKHLVFNSWRTGDRRLPHSLDMTTEEVRPLAGEAEDWVLARKSDRLFYRSGNRLHSVGVDGSDDAKPAGTFDGLAEVKPISMSLDANEQTIYAGAKIDDKQWGIAALDLDTSTWRTVVKVNFQVGHVQANPVTPGLVMFCHETGGDAPQRTWVLDASQPAFRPFYRETYNEWVTHEVWWGADRAIFTIWPYDDEHRGKPHGVVSADLETGSPTVHSQFAAWHTHGSSDGKWAVADDMRRNIWLIRVETGERRLLTRGHKGKGFNTHPHPSITPDNRSVVFNSSRNGTEDIFLATWDDWESLPIA